MSPALLAALWCARAAAAPLALNQATAEELDALPMIGARKAALWVEWRSVRGGCAELEELRAIPGFGAATVAAIRPYVVCGPPVTEPSLDSAPVPALLRPLRVDINSADAAELASLPGLAPWLASAVVADRERNGPFPSCGELLRVPGLGPATVAALAPVCAVAPEEPPPPPPEDPIPQ